MLTRPIKDAKDLNTNKLIYFKSHAKVTYMSDGTAVEDAINNMLSNKPDMSNYCKKEEFDSSIENTHKLLDIILNGGEL